MEKNEITTVDAAMSDSWMALVLKNAPPPPQKEELVEGRVIGKVKTAVYIDLTPFGTGII